MQLPVVYSVQWLYPEDLHPDLVLVQKSQHRIADSYGVWLQLKSDGILKSRILDKVNQETNRSCKQINFFPNIIWMLLVDGYENKIHFLGTKVKAKFYNQLPNQGQGYTVCSHVAFWRIKQRFYYNLYKHQATLILQFNLL